MATTVKVVVKLKPGVLDAPGQAIRRGLQALGYQAEEVHVGKHLEIVLPDDASAPNARAGDRLAVVDEMCRRFLANPLVETWEILPS